MTDDNHQSKVSHEELCDKALKHYEKVSNEAANWNSVVPKAIRFYKKHGGDSSSNSVESGYSIEDIQDMVDEFTEKLEREERFARGHMITGFREFKKWLKDNNESLDESGQDSSKSVEEPPKNKLPTAADVFFYNTGGEVEPKAVIRQDEEINFEEADELVRRKDIEKLIESYLDDIKSEIERIEKEDDVDSNSDVAKVHHELQIETLKGLLEEIQHD